MKNRIKKAVCLLSGCITVTAGILFGLAAIFYEMVFHHRFERDGKPYPLTLQDFPELEAKAAVFQSGKELLRGNFYTAAGAVQKRAALIIFCHGFSNGSRDYLSQIHYFARMGFEVLAYDNAGCHASTGKNTRGMHQSMINLKDVMYALEKEEKYVQYRHKPLVLMGHSWGGFAVNAVFQEGEYPNVRAVVSFSAPNSTRDMLVRSEDSKVSRLTQILVPFVMIIERMKFGKEACYTARGGIDRTYAHVMIVQSRDDTVVRYESSVAFWQERFTNPNVRLLLLEKGGHRNLLSDAARAYAQKLGALGPDKKKGRKLSAPQWEALLGEIDKMQLYELDEDVMRQAGAFVLEVLDSEAPVHV